MCDVIPTIPTTPSPLLHRHGAVPSPTDPTIAWHYGDPLAEQRTALRRAGLIDRWSDGLVEITGADRVELLDALSSQQFADLTDGESRAALWLSARGHVENWAQVAALPGRLLLRTEPGTAAGLADYLHSMRFRLDVTITDVTDRFASFAVIGPAAADSLTFMTLPRTGHVIEGAIAGGSDAAEDDGGGVINRLAVDRIELLVPREEFSALTSRIIESGATPIGTWAAEALRIAERRPRFGIDTDGKTLPNEVPAFLAEAVSMDKGCYRGQETVARISNIGAPPRRLVLLNLDGAGDNLPQVGEPILDESGRTVGRLGAAAYHWEDGPIALALVKRTVAPGVPLVAGGVDALIDPEDVVPPGPKLKIDRRQFIDFGRR